MARAQAGQLPCSERAGGVLAWGLGVLRNKKAHRLVDLCVNVFEETAVVCTSGRP